MTKRSMVPIEITPGEWFDRVTILEIKVQKLRGEKQLTAMSQLTALRESPRGQHLQYLRQTTAEVKKLASLLLKANSDLWDIEDKIRALDAKIFPLSSQPLVDSPRYGDDATLSPNTKTYLELARSVYVTNDERSARKREIDEYFKVQPEVKEYASYGQEAKPTSPE